jgi:hypothetical protein
MQLTLTPAQLQALDAESGGAHASGRAEGA